MLVAAITLGRLRVVVAEGSHQEPSPSGGTGARTAGGDAPVTASVAQVKPCADGDKGCTTTPRALYAPAPSYTKAARKAKVKGVVTMSVTVGPKGQAWNVTLDKKLGYGLDEAAVETVKEWKFKPATRDGVPVVSKVMITVKFDLY